MTVGFISVVAARVICCPHPVPPPRGRGQNGADFGVCSRMAGSGDFYIHLSARCVCKPPGGCLSLWGRTSFFWRAVTGFALTAPTRCSSPPRGRGQNGADFGVCSRMAGSGDFYIHLSARCVCKFPVILPQARAARQSARCCRRSLRIWLMSYGDSPRARSFSMAASLPRRSDWR